MENRLGNSNGVGIPKKSRSLDLKTLYNSSIPKDSVNKILKRKGRPEDVDDQQKQDKKGRKVVSLSSFEKFDCGNGRKVEKACNGDKTLLDLADSKVGLDEKLCNTPGLQGISLGFGGSLIYVPRRRRGFTGRSRFDNGLVQKSARESVNQVVLVDPIPKASGEESSSAQDTKVREKGSDGEGKGSDSASQMKLDNENSSQPAVKEDQLASKQTHIKSRKRKSLAQDDRTVGEEAKLSGDISSKLSEVSREDDEENLEANAARMLCSRFDPSCTEFSSNANAPASPSGDGLAPLSSGKNSRSKLSNSKCVSDDADDRMLRPRREHEDKGTIRKRRHFYEVLFSDVDSHWLLNKRIKVLWPLDESWYHGLVDNYDEERNLHHVKYDDRDEEWINLQGERFKILLFPAEIPGNNQRKRRRSRTKSCLKIKRDDSCSKVKKQNVKIEDDSCIGNMESEPIITWLARSSHRFKSSTLKAVKQRIKSAIPPSNGIMNPDGDVVGEAVGQDTSRSVSSVSSRGLAGQSGIDISLKTSCFSKHGKPPLVYYRRRFHSSKKGISGDHKVELLKHHHVSKSPDPEIDFWPVETSGTVELYLPWNSSKQIGFSLSLPAVSLQCYFLMGDVIWLSRVALLIHHGTVVPMWPRICLEIIFLNNQVGLRYLFFEGCLTQAVWLIFRFLKVFDQSDEQGTHTDLQLPASSIGFRLSCIPGFQRHLAFGFCSFSEVKHSKWTYLEQNVRRHSLLVKQLPISECMHANIKVFQKGQVLDPSVSGDLLLIEGLEKSSRHSIGPTLVSGNNSSSEVCPSSSEVWPSSISDKKQSYIPHLPALPCYDPPTIFQSLHLKMIIEHILPHLNPLGHTSAEHLETSGNLASDDRFDMVNFTGRRSESSPKSSMRAHAACQGFVCPSNHDRRTDEPVKSGTECGFVSPEKGQTIGPNITSSKQQEPQESKDIARRSQRLQQQQQSESENCTSSGSPVDGYKTATMSNLPMNGNSIHLPISDHCEDHRDREVHSSPQSSDLASSIQGSIIPSPNPTAPRSTGQRSRNSLFGYLSHGWSDSKGSFLHTNFGNGPKKPRTQVSYSLPSGGSDSRNKGPLHKGFPHKRIRRSSDRKSADVSRVPQKDLESISCDANVLATLGDRGWRECGAQIVLEPFDNNEWRLVVKISGTTRYSYRAHQFLQPGSTNRFTHAMMWKGGKDWILEFPDRSQWSLFKEMHEECYNRNIRAASVRNIPIPGIRMIEKDDDETEAPFTRNFSKYIRQTETDVEMALNPLRNMYDMDSDDEQWLLRIRECSEAENSGSCEISEDLFEKAMDMFEKAAYVKQRDQFALNEIEELMSGAGPLEAMKRIYDHWHTKRLRKGMPLIRHLQPPLWEKYQKELRDWELEMTRVSIPYSSGSSDRRVPVEKPAMFAFCLKPRGLEVQHKGSKHRAQKKLSVYTHQSTAFGDHEGFNLNARRSGGFASGDERVFYLNHSYELDDSPIRQVLPGMYSPRDPGSGYFSLNGNGYYRNRQNRLQRNNSRKLGVFASTGDRHMGHLYNHRMTGKRMRNDQWNTEFSNWQSPNLYYSNVSQCLNLEELHNTDIDEYKLRDAASAAKQARALAKLKRERAEDLRYKADLAIQKAAAALMCAEAVKASSQDYKREEVE